MLVLAVIASLLIEPLAIPAILDFKHGFGNGGCVGFVVLVSVAVVGIGGNNVVLGTGGRPVFGGGGVSSGNGGILEITVGLTTEHLRTVFLTFLFEVVEHFPQLFLQWTSM